MYAEMSEYIPLLWIEYLQYARLVINFSGGQEYRRTKIRYDGDKSYRALKYARLVRGLFKYYSSLC